MESFEWSCFMLYYDILFPVNYDGWLLIVIINHVPYVFVQIYKYHWYVQQMHAICMLYDWFIVSFVVFLFYAIYQIKMNFI